MRDDEDVSMAANPEPDFTAPRHRVPPRGSKSGHWGVAWIEGVDASPLEHGSKKCRDCNEPTAILHAVGNDNRRTHCGKCQGKWNRGRM